MKRNISKEGERSLHHQRENILISIITIRKIVMCKPIQNKTSTQKDRRAILAIKNK